MKKLVFAMLWVGFFSTRLLATTYTSAADGSWFSASTWSPAAVPGVTDAVVINHQVLLNGNATVASLTVNAGKMLMDDNNSRHLTVTGSIINNGTIQRNLAAWYFKIFAQGNITNNGYWKPYETVLEGTGNQTISCTSWLEGYWSVADTLGDIYAGSRLLFRGSTISGGNARFRTNGHTIETFQEALSNMRIISNDTLYLRESDASTVSITGDVKLKGLFYYRDNVVVNGTLTVLDSIYDDNSSRWLTINGNIINKGLIGRGPGQWYNRIYVTGNILNQGIWKPYETQLAGTSNQIISQTSGTWFEGYFTVTDTIGEVLLGSKVSFRDSKYEGSGSILRTNGNMLHMYNHQLRDMNIISNDTLWLPMSDAEVVNTTGNVILKGWYFYRSAVSFNGSLTVLDTIMDDNASRSLVVNGDLINKGFIARGPGGWYNKILVSGNILNQGIWKPFETQLTGNTNQYLEQSAGKWFEGYFTINDTLGELLLKSPVYFRQSRLEGNNGIIRTNGHRFTTISQGLRNLRFISNDTLELDGSDAETVSFTGNVKLNGNFYYKSAVVFNGTLTVLDTFWDDNASRTVQINGNLINKGYVGRYLGGWYNRVVVTGNIMNQGKWKPFETHLAGAGSQTISAAAGTPFENAVIIDDTLGSVSLASHVLFKESTIDLGGETLLTGPYHLLAVDEHITNGNLLTNDTLDFYNCSIKNLSMTGRVHLKGKVYFMEGNSVNGTLVLLDTLLDNGASYVFTVNGNMENYGVMRRGPGGWYSKLRINGDLMNQGTLEPFEVHLYDTIGRNISGPMMPTVGCAFILTDSVRLTGDNIINYLRTGSETYAWCRVSKGAKLQMLDQVAQDRILNFGTVTVKREVDTATSNEYSFYRTEARNKVNSRSSFLFIDHMGSQQHYTTSNAMNDWWRIRNYPQVFNDTLQYLRLHYSQVSLNGNAEDSLKIYHSANAGITWKRLATSIAINKTDKTITISNAPSYGHFVVSAGPAGSMSFDPVLGDAEPRIGGNSGTVSIYLFGVGFKSNSTVFLRRTGYANINADTAYLTAVTGESMLARFDLRGKAVGMYDLCVTVTGSPLLVLSNYFEIKPGLRSKPWVLMSGRDRYLVNRWQTFSLSYGNTSNTDAKGTWIILTISDRPGLEVNFPDWKFMLPGYFREQGPAYTRIADSVPLYYVSDTFSGFEGQRIRIYPVYIPIISAQSSKMVRIRVKCPSGNLSINSWLLDSWFNDIDYLGKADEPIPTEVRACITAAAMKAFAGGAIGLIPGAGCYNLVDKVVDPIGYITPESLKPGEPENVGGLWKFVSWASSITQCATSFMPGLNVATQMGIAVAGMIVDGVDGKNTNEACWEKFRRKSGNKIDTRGVTSFDPNEMVGPKGYASQNYIASSGLKNYRIFFENKATASAPALEVFIYDTLDKSKYDLSKFSFGAITFSDTTVQVQPYSKSFSLLVDRYPKMNIFVQVEGHLDTVTGAVYVAFHSLDRISLELTEYDTLGFLPPNKTSPEGEGNVSFFVALKPSLAFGTEVNNRATIVFDFNTPIVTNDYKNTIDDAIPSSNVYALPAVSDSSFVVSWFGTDQGCGIRHFNVFVSENDSAYLLWLANTPLRQSTFKGVNKRTYKFFVLATDSIGWTEPMKTSPEAFTYVNQGSNAVDETDNGLPRMLCYPNPARDMVEVKWRGAYPTMHFQLYSLQGKVMVQQTWNGAQGEQTRKIDVSGTAPGLYLIRMQCGDETFQQMTVIE